MPGTWQAQQKKLGLGSFGSVEQDIAALDLARQRTLDLGGLSYLQKQGLTPEFVAALAPEWASLPTKAGKSFYGQPVKAFSELEKTYQQGRQPLAPPSPTQAQAKDSGEGFDLLMRQLVGNINMPMLQTPQTPTSSFQNFLNTFGGFIR
jgi:hypothetical protein